MKKSILEAKNIFKSFSQPDKSRLVVLQDLFLEVERNTIIAITGASGSGKSTFLHLVGSLDDPDSGQILFNGRNIFSLDESQKAEYRNKCVGFVYQFHYLMPELNVIENVVFPSLMKNFDREDSYAKGEKLLTDVGLKGRELNMPYQLSGGERQRVAIARSLINSPELLLADEPTGNIDWKTGEKVFGMFRDLIKERNLTAVVVTHNEKLSELMDKSYHLHSGKLI